MRARPPGSTLIKQGSALRSARVRQLFR